LRCSFAHFKFIAHLLDLRCLLFQVCGESLNFGLLLCGSRFLFCDSGFSALIVASCFEAADFNSWTYDAL
jgi:hypothetical protein